MHLFALASILALTPPVLGVPYVADQDYASVIDNIATFLAGSGGCAGTAKDGPGVSPGAVWLRTAFHDQSTFNPRGVSAATRGGGDGSIMNEFNRPDNLGLCALRIDAFAFNEVDSAINMTHADLFAIGALATVETCGGPNIRWFPERDDLPDLVDPDVVNPAGLLPSPHDSYEVVIRKFRRMGLSKVEILTVVTGSHTMGFAANPVLFFNSYSTAFEQFLNLTVSPLTHSLSHAVDPTLSTSATTNSSQFPFNRVTLKPLPPRPIAPGPATAASSLCPLGPPPIGE
ncbi:heme peroxidase [Blyttiomyces helicus]|uniref:Peroxidase n=1 Tax=Blyttiomyces helicus TaxID=388810 RepID=A0A4P9W0H8_9FUNG|nr:heme peroxidase [Blyttiomyces helicus]|eukprot:RKO85629.1 heme peroxidase [Blyttiomyces helicus]